MQHINQILTFVLYNTQVNQGEQIMNIKQLLCSVCLAHTPLIATEVQIPLDVLENHRVAETRVTPYEHWTGDGFIMNADIEEQLRNVITPRTAKDLHQRIFTDASLDNRIFLYMCAKEEMGSNESLRSYILPKAWKVVNYFSFFGKYAVSAVSPISSVAFLVLSALKGDPSSPMSGSVSESTGRDGSIFSTIFKYPGIITISDSTFRTFSQILNTTALLTYQIGYNVSTNAYEYSSSMRRHFSDANFEKKYIQATMNFGTKNGGYEHLPPKCKFGPHDDLDVNREYYDEHGPIGTALLRDTMRQLHNEQSTKKGEELTTTVPQEEQEARRHTPKYFYNWSNLTSLAAGALYVGSGLLNILSVSLLASEVAIEDNMTKQILANIQLPCCALSVVFSHGANWLWKKSATYGRRYMLSGFFHTQSQDDIAF